MNIKPPSWLRSSLLSLALLLTLGAGCAQAAVAFVSHTDKTPATGSSIVYTSVAVGATSNPAIVLHLGFSSTTATVSSVVLSAGLTSGTPVQIKTVRQTDDFLSVWCVPAPSGTGTITVTLSASVAWQSSLSLFSGADQTAPCPSADAVSAVSTAGVSSLTITPAHLAAADAASGCGANTVGNDVNGVTPNARLTDDTTAINFETGDNGGGTGALTATWLITGPNPQAAIGVRIQAPTGGGAACTDSHMLGVWRCDEAAR